MGNSLKTVGLLFVVFSVIGITLFWYIGPISLLILWMIGSGIFGYGALIQHRDYKPIPIEELKPCKHTDCTSLLAFRCHQCGALITDDDYDDGITYHGR